MPDASGPPVGRGIWNGTTVELPLGRIDPNVALRDVFTGAELRAEQADGRWALPAAALFERLPVSLLVPSTPCSI
jgi:hypothetical protein